MKSHYFSLGVYFTGLGFFAIMAFIGVDTINISSAIEGVEGSVLVLIGVIIILIGHSFFNMLANLSTDHDVNHMKKILKKHGLWQDETIKRKDLPK